MSIKYMVTAEQLWEMPNPLDKRRELVDGEVLDVSPTTIEHAVIVTRVARLVDEFVERHDLGIVATGDPGYVLRRDPDLVRAPDVSFIARERIPESGLPKRGFWEGWPTFAVEVVSPDDRATEVHTKVQQFLQAGTRLVWIVWPDQRSETVYDAIDGVRELGPEERLDGGDILQGFTAKVSDLFDVGRRR